MKILGAHAENLGAHLKCPVTQLVKLLAILTVLLINALVINEQLTEITKTSFISSLQCHKLNKIELS